MKTQAYVIDASTSLKWVFTGEADATIAQTLLQNYLTGKLELLSPDLWLYEIANGIRSAVMRRLVPVRKGQKLLKLLFDARPQLVFPDPLITQCYKNAIKFHISLYDSAYVTLALETGEKLITSDAKLITAVNQHHKIALLLKEMR